MEKIMYVEINALSNKSGRCWATNQYFAELYDVEPTTVSAWINSLLKNGFITVTGAKSKQRVISLASILRKKQKVSSEKVEGQPSEKAEHNNTSINSTQNNSTAEAVTHPKFNQEEEVKKLMSYNQYWLNVIGLFIKRKGMRLTSKAQLSEVIKRHSRAAKQVAVFDREQIIGAIQECESFLDKNQKPISWTLETVLKQLTK